MQRTSGTIQRKAIRTAGKTNEFTNPVLRLLKSCGRKQENRGGKRQHQKTSQLCSPKVRRDEIHCENEVGII